MAMVTGTGWLALQSAGCEDDCEDDCEDGLCPVRLAPPLALILAH